jgi:ABC-type sugar transport system substrate-binding protein
MSWKDFFFLCKYILPVCMRVAFLFLLLMVQGYYLSSQTSEQSRSAVKIVPRVAIFTPTTQGNTYWPEVHQILSLVAADLDLDLFFYEFDVGDRFAKAREGVQILQSQPFDGAVFSVAFGQAQPLMDAAEAQRIPFFLNGPLFPHELEVIGVLPRNLYQFWIGYFLEDEFLKGYELGKYLFDQARQRNLFASDGSIHAVGIGGDSTWFGSELRVQGFIRAAQEDRDVQILQTVATGWTPSEAREMTHRLIRRYPEVSVIWAASDQLALGVVQGIQDIHSSSSRILTGGLDLSSLGLQAVEANQIQATVAETPLIWAKILIMLYDYIQGHDFDQSDTRVFSFPPLVADKTNVHEFIDLRNEYPRLNFRNYSRHFGYQGDDLNGSIIWR